MDNTYDGDDYDEAYLARARSAARKWAERVELWKQLPWYYRLWFRITGRGL